MINYNIQKSVFTSTLININENLNLLENVQKDKRQLDTVKCT